MIIESAGNELGAYPIHDMPTVPTWHNGPIVARWGRGACDIAELGPGCVDGH